MSAAPSDLPLQLLTVFEDYEQSLVRDPGPMPLIGGFFKMATCGIESVGYEKSDIVAALISLASQILASDPRGRPEELAQSVAADVRGNIEFFRACASEADIVH